MHLRTPDELLARRAVETVVAASRLMAVSARAIGDARVAGMAAGAARSA